MVSYDDDFNIAFDIKPLDGKILHKLWVAIVTTKRTFCATHSSLYIENIKKLCKCFSIYEMCNMWLHWLLLLTNYL